MNTPTLTTLYRQDNSHSAEVAAAELVRLYVQEGHNHQACHRFLKKRRRRRPVCVCRPLVKGFPFLTSTAICFTSRGCKQPIQSCTNEDTGCVLVISIWDAKSTYLQSSSHAVTPLFHGLIPWSLHDRPQNLFPPQTCSRLAATLTVRVQTLFNHTVLADFFAMPFHHLPSQRGN